MSGITPGEIAEKFTIKGLELAKYSGRPKRVREENES
jgi:hypothetical protein